ncbi:MAG: efflux RND transporter periplasmic adaptor subunit [Flavobacteriales bacterium]
MAKERKRRSRKKRIFWIIGGGLLFLILLTSYFSSGSELTKVAVGEVKLRNITETVNANGKVQPEVKVKISSDVSGEIVELPVKEGDRVQKGELIAKIQPDVYESALNQAEASLNNSKAQLANAKAQLARVRARFKNVKATYQRKKRLYEQDSAISQAEYLQAESDYGSTKAEVEAQKETVKAAKFSVQSAKASMKEARKNLKRTTIHAPRSGTITGLEVEKGERVVGTNQMSGTKMMSISELEDMEVNVEVNENDIVRVSMGDTAKVEVDAYLDQNFKGVVTEMANTASSSSETGNEVTDFPVKIRILRSSYDHMVEDSSESPFRPGMSATVAIATRTVENVPSVPIRAVTTRKDSTEKENGSSRLRESAFSLGKDGNHALLKFLKTGIQNDRFIQVKEGLDTGTKVITAPYDVISKKLKDSSKVKEVPKEALFKGS